MGSGYLKPIEKCELLEIGKWIKLNKKFVYNAHSTELKANNAEMLFDGKYYYAAVANVPMWADPNVSVGGFTAAVTVETGRKISGAVWLDNATKAEVDGNKIKVEPFPYGVSLGSRIVRFTLK